MSDETLNETATEEKVEVKLSKKQKFKKEFKSIVLIVIAVLGFRSTFFEPFKIPSGSMIPTLLIGDFMNSENFQKIQEHILSSDEYANFN